MSAAAGLGRASTGPPGALPQGLQRRKASLLAEVSGALLLVACDFAIVWGCLLAGYFLRMNVLTRLPVFQIVGEPAGTEAYLFFVPIYLLILGLAGLYTRRPSGIEESVIVLRACFYATLGALVVSSIAHVSEILSRTVVAISALMTAAALPLARNAVKRALARWSRWQRPVVLVGINANGLRAARDLCADSVIGYRVAGIFLDRRASDRDIPPEWPVWRVDSVEDAVSIARREDLHSFVLCEDGADRGALPRLFRMLEGFAGEIRIAAAGDGLDSLRVESELLRSSYLLSYHNPLTAPANRILKRAVDLTAGLALCMLFAPAFIAIPILILITSGRPIFFRQVRLGLGGRRFQCLKFRTMHIDAEQRLRKQLESDRAAEKEFHETYKLRYDPRVTRIGAWLRRTSLDELPQLWNVLRGEMSLVGPRPIVPDETGKYDVEITNYFRVRCGLTGLWQISGRNDVSYAERVRLDVFYIRNWSVWLDIVILARTAAHLMWPRGAY